MSDETREIGDLRVVIHRERCIGSAACVKAARELFRLDDQQIVTFAASAATTPRERILDACAVCPVDALEAFGPDGTRLAP